MSGLGLTLNGQTYACEAIIFDLDGTLVDTSEDLWNSLQTAFQLVGEPVVPYALFMNVLHHGLEQSVQLALASRELSCERVATLADLYRAHYQSLGHASSMLYPGAQEMLKQCHALGYRLAVCTNKETASAQALLGKLGVRHLFETVLGIDQVESPKPSPEPLRQIMAQWALGPEQTVYVGDSILDAKASQAANVRFFLHRAGFGAASVSEACTDGAFDHFGDIEPVLYKTPAVPGVVQSR